jgi:hypothetical protein
MISRDVLMWMAANVGDYKDPRTGEVNCTKMAEAACEEFSLWVDDEVPEVLFEWALDIAEEVE